MIETAPDGMTEELWLKRCAARFRSRMPDMSVEESNGCAEACFENISHDLMEHPEYSADEDLSCWG